MTISMRLEIEDVIHNDGQSLESRFICSGVGWPFPDTSSNNNTPDLN